MTFGEQVIKLNEHLSFDSKLLPLGFDVLNSFTENPETLQIMKQFYNQYYNDNEQRKFIIGINPSRHGAGVTGVPFTDTKRLFSECGIEMKSAHTHEVSSVFLYDVIKAFGGAKSFYKNCYINSPFPLAIIREVKPNSWVNANYYDDLNLFESVKSFMIQSLKKHFELNVDNKEVYVLGKRNAAFIQKLNNEAKLFDKMIVLEHPRYIQQYQSKNRELYIDKYIEALSR